MDHASPFTSVHHHGTTEGVRTQTEPQFRALVESSLDAVTLLSIDGVIRYASQATTAILGYAIDDFVGTNAFSYVHPDDLPAVQRLPAELLAVPGKGVVTEFRFRHADGSWLWLECRLTNLLDDPAVASVVSHFRDVGEARRAAEELRRSEERHRAFVRATSTVTWTTGPDGLVDRPQLDWERYSGQRWPQYAGQGWIEAIHPDDRGTVRAAWVCGREGRMAFEMRARIWDAALATYRHNIARAAPLFDEAEAVREWFGVTIDIHEQVLAEQQLTQRNRLIALQAEVVGILIGSGRLRSSLQSVAEALARHTRGEVWVWLVDATGETLELFAEAGEGAAAAPRRVRLGQGTVGRIAASREESLLGLSTFDELAGQAEGVGNLGIAGFPLLGSGNLLGVLVAGTRGPFDRQLQSDLRPLVGAVAQAVDARRLERQIRQHSRVIEQASHGIAVADVGGTVTLWNRGAERMFGVSAEEMIGRSIREIYPDRAIHEREVVEPLRQGRSVETELVLRRPGNGERFVAHLALVNLYDESGRPIGSAGHAIDVTERYLAEAALRESEASFRELADAIPQLVISGEPDGWVTYSNRRWREHTGLGPEWHADWLEAVDDDDRERVRPLWSEALRAGRPVELEIRLRGAGSQPSRWFLMRTVMTPAEEGRPGRWLATLTDIDEHKRQHEELRIGARRKDEFLAMLGHELRNPLAPIRNAAHVLRRLAAEQPAVERATTIVERQVRHMSRLVDDLLDVSRITSGKIVLRRESVELRSVVAAAVETSMPAIEGRGHELRVRLPGESIVIDGDPTRLTQVFANLLDNAAKYTPPGGVIDVEAASDRGWVTVRVRDNGIGISETMIPHVFDLFAQGDRPLDRANGGLGIGLTLVRRLVELHGGSVEATSGGERMGSELVVRLPVIEPAADAKEATGTAPVAESEPRSRRVLIVDDNVDSAESLGALLSLQGYVVRIEHDGPAALEAVAAFAPDVVLLDVGLPGMNGYEVAQRLRSGTGPAPRLLCALTGYGGEEQRALSSAAGFDVHLVKPVDPDELGRLLEGC